MATFAKVRNWRKFQHYTDRKPPWIKLHRELLDDFDYISLPLASKALAPLIWLLAAESEDGAVRVDFDWLAFRLRVTAAEAEAGVTPLIDRGFLECASRPLALCQQLATPERETEAEGETEKHLARPSASRFGEFWSLYPVKKGKADAERKWKARKLDAIADRILADVRDRMARDRQWRDGYVPHGSTYVNGSGWEDAIVEARAGPAPPMSKTAEAFLTLEGMKSENQLDPRRNSARTSEAAFLVAGPDSGG
jgi:hypothetical protein